MSNISKERVKCFWNLLVDIETLESIGNAAEEFCEAIKVLIFSADMKEKRGRVKGEGRWSCQRPSWLSERQTLLVARSH